MMAFAVGLYIITVLVLASIGLQSLVSSLVDYLERKYRGD